jgi:hypothetical protein
MEDYRGMRIECVKFRIGNSCSIGYVYGMMDVDNN